MVEPEAVLAVRKVPKGEKNVIQWLVSWKGKSSDEATWEDALFLKSQFPELKLEDKQFLLEGGIDKNQENIGLHEPLANAIEKGPKEWIVYSRRKKGAN